MYRSLLILRPPPLRTTSIEADCRPRESPPASSPALSAAHNFSASSPVADSNARPIDSGTCGPTRIFPCADQVLPCRSPTHVGAFGPVYAAMLPFESMLATYRPSL